MATERVLIVFNSGDERAQARLFENHDTPFAVGHLEQPELLSAAIARIKPDLIIFYLSPAAEILEVCARLRGSSAYGGLIALMFVSDETVSAKIAIDAGADGILSADLTTADLIARIKSLLRAGRVYTENFRRAQATARANAEAAEIVMQLEAANRKIREQNTRIVEQQQKISEHLEQVNNEMTVAARLQISLLPDAPAAALGYDISLQDCYIPATELGGDYFDYLRLPDDRLFICVADVTGHGIAPALVGVQMRALARSHLLQKPDLARTMNILNQFMSNTFNLSYLMTMAAIFYHPLTGEIELANAGHCPPVHFISAKNNCVEYPAPNVPLGIVANAQFEICKLHLSRRDRLLIYSDGITEIENGNGEQFGAKRLISAFRANIEEDHLPQRIAKIAGDFGGQDFADDVTMVALGRR